MQYLEGVYNWNATYMENKSCFLSNFQLLAWKSADMQQLQIQKMAGNLSQYPQRLNSTINSTVKTNTTTAG